MEKKTKQVPKKRVNVRRIGHSYERLIVQDHKKLGYERAASTRATSRIMDDAKIDINGIPFNIQCKSVRKGLNVFTTLNEMVEAIPKLVPEREQFINLVFHKKEREEVVVISKSDWYLVVEKLKENGIELKKPNCSSY